MPLTQVLRHALLALWYFVCVCVVSATLVSESAAAAASSPRAYRVYVGTYTRGDSQGIYICELDTKTGALKQTGVRTGIKNPSFLAVHPNRRFLYSVAEIGDFEGKESGGVAAFSIDPKTGGLTALNQQSSEGSGPCHLVVDHSGKCVLVANYGGGSVAALPINDDGTLGKATSSIQHEGSIVNQRRQNAPRAHSINVDDSNRFAVAADLGIDKLLIYRLDASRGTLTPNDPAYATVEPGAGPRHFCFHPNQKFAYVINESDMTVTAFAIDSQRGSLTKLQTISTLPEDVQNREGFSTAEIRVHPSGKFLYGSNRGHDSIIVYRVDPQTGKLAYVENEPTQGKTPRNFELDPTGTFLLAQNQDSHTIVVFRIDGNTGELESTGNTLEIPSPVCIRMIPIDG